ncbi:MAG: RHS repeat-associated core domain-containing protein [Thiobacillus sp.]
MQILILGFLLLTLAFNQAGAKVTPNSPGSTTHFHIEEYFSNGEAALQACMAFSASHGYFPPEGDPDGWCHHAYYQPLWEAGWLCEQQSLHFTGCPSFYLGDYYYPTCPNGQLPNRDTGACEYSPKNNDDCGEGNPIKANTGNKRQRENDLPNTAVFQFSRVYNSNPPLTSVSIGTAWTHTYARSVNSQSFGLWMLVRRQDGKSYNFNPVSGAWATDADISDRLTELKDANGITGWQYLVAADDSIETYSAAGKLLSIADRTGRIQTLTYDLPLASGGDDDPETLDTVTDDTGRQLRFTYDTNKRIATVTDPAGGVITYGYDAQSNLVSVTYPDGRSKTYHYNEPENTSGANLPHALTGITDENGDRYATYQYAIGGEAISTGHANGADLHTLAYNPDGTTTVTDPLGTARTYNFTTVLGVVKSTGVSQPGGSGCGAASSAITYDPNGNVASRADFNGHKSCYAYDLTRNLETAHVEGLASGSSCPSNPATYTPAANSVERKILTQWDSRFRLPVKITEAGRETSTVYDSRGNVTRRSIKDLASGQTRTWTTAYTYHATVPGVLVQKVEDGPRIDVSDLTTTDYYAPDENCVGDPLGCRGQVKQVTNALGHITHVDEYDANGRVLRTTDPNGLVTTFSYSPRGWLLSRTVGTELTQFDYDGVGQLTKLTRPDGSYVNFEYDPAHRLTAIVQMDGSRLTYTLDAMGNRTHEAITSPDGGTVYYTHSRTFDTLGRLWQDIGAYNQTVTYYYDAQGNMKQVDGARTDVADIITHSYDALDRLTQTLNADGGIEQFKTNALDQTTQVVDPANQATIQALDAFGDVTQTQSADTGTTTRTFDEAGNLKAETDARGVTVSYTWDALNRLTRKQSSGGAATPVYTFFYDTCSKGRLCAIQRSGVLDQTFTYDLRGRLTYQNSVVPGVNAFTSQYAYDTYGRLSQISYPTGRSVTYSYDAEGRINQVATQPQSGSPVTVLASTINYGYPFAGPSSFNYGNGQSFQQSLDQDYRPSNSVDGPRNKVLSYDLAGDIVSQTDIDTTVLTYGYDATGRLVSAIDTASNGFGSLGYSYDKNGNRTVETRNASNLGYVYNPAGSNWLYQRGSYTYYRMPNGNPESTTTITFGYDGFNRYVTAKTVAEFTTYTYNAFGQRTKKINQNGLSTVFHYGPDGELLYERDANGNTKAYVWLDGRPLARIDNDAQIYYYHVDHLGTPQAMTDQSGTTVWKAYYDPFGKATLRVSTVENNLRFPGQYYDRETGMQYNYFRDYDPTTGRYVEADPIGLAGGLNLYSYVGGNPVNEVDPEGLAPQGNFPGSSCGPEGNPNNFPNNWTGNYEPACNWHDWCYSQCGVTKEYCDAAFYQQMRSSCSTISTLNDFLGATKSLCQRQAWAYHFAVDNFGQKAFDKAQEHCQCQK